MTFRVAVMNGDTVTVETSMSQKVGDLKAQVRSALGVAANKGLELLHGTCSLAPEAAALSELAEQRAWPAEGTVELAAVLGALCVKRHVYNQGVAPPYRGSYLLTATEELKLDPFSPLGDQMALLLNEDVPGPLPAMHLFLGEQPPAKWEEGASGGELYFSTLAGEVFDAAHKSLVVLVPMRGMD